MRLSRPPRAHLGFASGPLFVAATAAVVALCMAHGALAAECADGENEGVCLDAATFQWCDDGELKTANCPDGQMCVTDNPWYDGAGCVSTADTACGDIPAQGECTTANSVVWCDEGTPRVQPCDEDSVCGWDQDSGWYDCLPAGNNALEGPDASFAATDAGGDEGSSAPGPDDSGPSTDDEESDVEERGDPAPDDLGRTPRADVPTPTVTQGGEDEGNTAPPTEAGCAGGTAPAPWTLLVLYLVWGLSRRRRECSVATA